MEPALILPASALFLGIPLKVVYILIPLLGIFLFAYIIIRRISPLLKASPDNRLDRIPERIKSLLKIWFLQWRQPRYMFAGVLHILIFAGFIILSIQSFQMVMMGVFNDFTLPGFDGPFEKLYDLLKDYSTTWVLIAVVIAAVRRGVFTPARYTVPPIYGKGHTLEALFVLGMIALLMVSESLFEASLASAQITTGIHSKVIAPFTLVWFFKSISVGTPISTLQGLYSSAFFIHEVTFFFFLCFLPMGKHFHVITSIFNVFFMRLDRGNVKPVRYGIGDDDLDKLESFGVKYFEDFTWKHILDFYTCADCGRCSDRCPANDAGRPLSPRFISIKGRDYAFSHFPLIGCRAGESEALIGRIYSDNEIWSCTTCGACEQECPLGIEYIDKIIDLRRGMVDEGNVPQSLQKPLDAIEKRGNPWGKMERKRAEWAEKLAEHFPVKILDNGISAETLYFVDSVSSFDDRMQEIARSTARILSHAGIDFGILGRDEKDSGHEVRRFGEETLFQELKNQNTGAIYKTGVKSIITADPHAYNALRKDYMDLPPVEHISETIVREMNSGRIRLKPVEDDSRVYVYHDPCYLGRHNGLYDEPRQAIDAIPEIKRVEMEGDCRDRSFCCGGGGLMLFYEPQEEQRMGVIRVQMAKKAGANTIITACPFCLLNIEDAIKVSRLEGEMQAIDLCELIDQHMII